MTKLEGYIRKIYNCLLKKEGSVKKLYSYSGILIAVYIFIFALIKFYYFLYTAGRLSIYGIEYEDASVIIDDSVVARLFWRIFIMASVLLISNGLLVLIINKSKKIWKAIGILIFIFVETVIFLIFVLIYIKGNPFYVAYEIIHHTSGYKSLIKESLETVIVLNLLAITYFIYMFLGYIARKTILLTKMIPVFSRIHSGRNNSDKENAKNPPEKDSFAQKVAALVVALGITLLIYSGMSVMGGRSAEFQRYDYKVAAINGIIPENTDGYEVYYPIIYEDKNNYYLTRYIQTEDKAIWDVDYFLIHSKNGVELLRKKLTADKPSR